MRKEKIMLNKKIDDSIKFQKRTLILAIGKIIFSIILIGKLYYLQIINKSKFGRLSETNRIKIRILYPERGVIYDINGNKLAQNRIDYQITILKENLKYIDKNIKELSKIIFFSDDEINFIKKNLKKKTFNDYVIIKRNLDWNELQIFEYYSYLFPNLSIQKQKVRNYDNGYAFSHIVGYIGYESKKKKNSLQELKVGKTGLENRYNHLLQGKEGIQKVESNSSGKIVRLLDAKLSKPGKNIETFINKDLQEYCFELLSGKSGSIIVIDVRNGGIVSLVSSPSFDINNFSYGIKNQIWRALQTDQLKPLLNKSISGLYSPGSTFKLIVALLVMQDKSFNVNQSFFCNGHVDLAGHKFHCWKRKGHGKMNLSSAIKESCDCYFYNLANSIEIDDLSKISKVFSIGKKTGIDLPNESSGLMPNRNWKKQNKADSWHLGETYNAVIGQGFTLSTPLQMATMTARLASGKMIIPSIVKKEQNFVNLNLDSEHLDFVRKSMYRVVNEYKGTAFSSRIKSNSYQMVGKTATSQVRRISLTERETGVLENDDLPYNLRDHSIFTGYTPFNDPNYAISVVIEHHGSGSKVAAPIAKKALEFILNYKNKQT